MYAASGRHTQAGIDARYRADKAAQDAERVAAAKSVREAYHKSEADRLDDSVVRAEAALLRAREARDAFKPILINKSRARRVIETACRVFKCTEAELKSARRDREIVIARMFIAYWICRLTKLSLPQIGRVMNRDHTTILHAKREYPVKRAKMGRTLRGVR